MIHLTEKGKIRVFIIFLVAYLILFLIISITNQDYEYIYYNLLIAGGFMILIYFNKEIHLQPYSILGLIILGFLHLAGGNFLVGGFKLYQTSILSIPYDKIVHFVGSFIITFIVYNLVKPFLEKKNRTKIYPAFFIVFLISVGLGAMVEIVEFLATVIFERTIVGNYANNALDLVANTLGALIASGISVKHLIKKL